MDRDKVISKVLNKLAKLDKPKDLHFRLNTSDSQLKTKKLRAENWISQGIPVKLVMQLYGKNERTQIEVGKAILEKFTETIKDIKIDTPPEMKGNFIVSTLSPL